MIGRPVADFLAEWESKCSAHPREDGQAEPSASVAAVDRRLAETAYEQLLRGQAEAAKRYLRLALYPNGGCDLVATRVGAPVGATQMPGKEKGRSI